MTYVKTYLSTLKTRVVNLKRDAKGLSRDLLRLEVRGKLGSKTLYWHNGQCVINKSPVVCGHLAFLLQSFFNAIHKHISKYRAKCGSHSDNVCLFKQLTIKNEKLILSCCEKIDKVLSTEMKLVCFIEPIVRKCLISE